MGFDVDEATVADFGLYLGAEAGYVLPTIETLARDEGMGADGFTGLLEPLGDVVKGDASVLVGSAFSLMQRKLCDLGDSVNVDLPVQDGQVQEAHQRTEALKLRWRGIEHLGTRHHWPRGRRG